MGSPKLNQNKGATFLFFVFLVGFLVLFTHILVIQITGKADGKVLAKVAAEKYDRSNILKADRGTIYDSNGDALAEDVPSYTLIAILDKKVTTDPAHPQNVVNPRLTAEKLATVINMSEDDIYKILTKKGKFQVEFGKTGKDLSYDTMKKIEALKLPGITFEAPEPKRFYPESMLASNLIGFAQKEQKGKQEVITGKMGIEQSFNNLLEGHNGKLNYKGDLWGYILPGSKEKVKKPQNGKNVYLTIDEKIQTFVDDAIQKTDAAYHPKKITAVVADPKTGKILGMGQSPSFNLETREGIENAWQNEAVENVYEPGSVMKIFTLSAAVQQGVFDPNETYKSGTFSVKGVPRPIRDYNTGWGTITYLDGLQRSSNVAFSKLVDKIGQKTYRDYLDRFHFGKPTGIQLPNESAGKILYKYPIERYTTAFGQGTTVTTMQMIQAATAVANDGKMMKPYIVDKVEDPNTGKDVTTKPEVVGNPISADTAKTVRDYLRTVVTGKDGTGKIYDLPGFDVTGKTGTAQIANPNGGGYLYGAENYIFSFLGMAPKNNPKLIVYVWVQQPHLQPGESGSDPVKMVFNSVMKNSLQYLNIMPDKKPKKETASVPNVKGKSSNDAIQQLKEKKLTPVLLGKGDKVVSQMPNSNSSLLQGGKVMLKTNGKASIPNMKNWSKADVIKAASLLNLNINMNGNGYLTAQSISPGSPVKPGEKLTVNFTSPNGSNDE